MRPITSSVPIAKSSIGTPGDTRFEVSMSPHSRSFDFGSWMLWLTVPGIRSPALPFVDRMTQRVCRRFHQTFRQGWVSVNGGGELLRGCFHRHGGGRLGNQVSHMGANHVHA